MHGELLKARGLRNTTVVDWAEDMDADSRSDVIGNEPLRPHIVWFGEMPLYMNQIINHIHQCDLFVSIGTSGLVYPAAGFVSEVKADKDTVELNLGDTPVSSNFKEHCKGKATEVVAKFFDQIL